MKLESAIRVTLGVAMVFGSYIGTAEAISCLASQTMTIENCPPGGTGPRPDWPGWDTWGDPTDPDAVRPSIVPVPLAPDNPYPVSCHSSVADRIRSASYAVRYFISYKTAQTGNDQNFPKNTQFYVKLSDGTLDSYVDVDAVYHGAPWATGVNLELNSPPAMCQPWTSAWPQLDDDVNNWG